MMMTLLHHIEDGLRNGSVSAEYFYTMKTLRGHEDRAFKKLMRTLQKAKDDLFEFTNLYAHAEEWYDVDPNRFL
jgi:hypothetical protein